MAVFRVEKNKGYTVMSNHHLRNKELSLKAKGLLSQMLSLPEDWDYTLAGLSLINRESIDAIRTAVWELEKAGYITRRQGRDEKGKMTAIEYTIYEQPQPPALDCPVLENPTADKPILENPTPDNPTSENPTQLNKEIQKTNLPKKEKLNTDISSTHSIPFHSLNPSPLEDAAQLPERKRKEALYEKRLLTYPRTDSAFLTDDMGDTAAGIIKLLCGKFSFMAGKDFTPELGKVLNSKKVSDHHAIIPTMELAKTDLAALPESERNILTLSGARLLMATAAPHTFEAVTAVFECAGQSFTARGKTVLSDGWKEIDRRYRAALKNKPETDDADSDTEKTLPPFTEGQTFDNPAATVTEHDTTPPKPHNEASLLSAMERAGSEDTDPDAERKGLGTPATRAAVIEKLVKGGFVERKGKQLLPTKDGINLVCVLPDTLTSPQLTAEWENNLTQIAKGKADPAAFMEGIENMARELVKTYPFLSDDKAQMFKPEREALGSCPRCGSPVYEGKKNYYCSNKECIFTMWKNDRFFEERKVTFTPKIAAALLKSGKVNVKKLYSPKTGKTYNGTIVLADTGGRYVNYRIELPKKK